MNESIPPQGQPNFEQSNQVPPPHMQPGAPQANYAYQQKGPTPMEGFFNWIRGLGIFRTNDRWLGGVAAGIAHRVGMQPWVMRLILLALMMFAGLSLWVYIIAWILLPNNNDGTIPLQRWIG